MALVVLSTSIEGIGSDPNIAGPARPAGMPSATALPLNHAHLISNPAMLRYC
jgi:hypothetical protein